MQSKTTQSAEDYTLNQALFAVCTIPYASLALAQRKAAAVVDAEDEAGRLLEGKSGLLWPWTPAAAHVALPAAMTQPQPPATGKCYTEEE